MDDDAAEMTAEMTAEMNTEMTVDIAPGEIAGDALARSIAKDLRTNKKKAAIARRRLRRALQIGTILPHVAETRGLVAGHDATDRIRTKVAGVIGEDAEEALFEEAGDTIVSPVYVEGYKRLKREKYRRSHPVVCTDSEVVLEAAASMSSDVVGDTMTKVLEAKGIAGDPALQVPCQTPGCPNKKTQLVFVQTRGIDEAASCFYSCDQCGKRRKGE